MTTAGAWYDLAARDGNGEGWTVETPSANPWPARLVRAVVWAAVVVTLVVQNLASGILLTGVMPSVVEQVLILGGVAVSAAGASIGLDCALSQRKRLGHRAE